MKRRTFLKTSAIAAAGTSILPMAACNTKKRRIGLQIYSVRNALNRDLEGTLAAIAGMGYQLIEHAGYRNGLIYGKRPGEFKRLIDSLGMKLVSGHVGINLSGREDDWKKVIADNAEAGLEFFVVPSIASAFRDTPEHLTQTCHSFNKLGTLCKEYGMTFGYHNHAHEFTRLGNQLLYDQIVQQTDPDLVTMELDIYWAIKGKADPVTLFQQYPGRFKLWHVKDMEAGDEGFFAEVGYGVIDYKTIFQAASTAGLEYYFVEQDASRRDPLESVRMSAEYLKKQDWAG
ncbi:MAG: sugar phosphate isomerase/epimerase [Bacteroidales bacterium]|nr:sugar phosphate isomerase/epimerase [Bacteroidales bacterium]